MSTARTAAGAARADGREALRFGALGALLAVAAVAAPPELPPALAVLGALTLPGALWLALRERGDDARALLTLLLAAVALRAVCAVVVHYAAPPEFFALDPRRYDLLGWELARYWAGDGPRPGLPDGKHGYFAWNALLYTILGHVPLAPELANAALGGYAAVLAWRIAFDLGGRDAARLAGALTALCPSLVLWSSLNLKDALAILSILVMLRGAQRLATRAWPRGLAAVALGLAGLAQLRGYLALVAACALAIGAALPRLRGAHAPVAMGILVAAGAVAVTALGPIDELAEEADLGSVDLARRNLAYGASAYHGDADVSTPQGALRFLPIGLAYFLLAPAPWQVWNTRQLLTLPEMLVWYALLPQVLIGIALALRSRFAAALPVATFALFATLSYALVEANLGTAYRHRAQVLVPLFIFAAVGIAARRARRAAAPSARPRPEAVAGAGA